MGPLNIKYNIYIKNKTRKSATWVLRVREDDRTKDVPLHTQDPNVAKKALEKAQFALKAYNYAVEEDKPTEGLLDAVVRVESAQRQKEASGTFISIREAMEAWEVHQRRTGVREATIRTYHKALKQIIELDQSIRTATETDKILAKCDHVSSATRHSYMSALKGFREFLMDKYQVAYRVGEIPVIRVDPVKPQVQWNIYQMRRIIDNVRITVLGYRTPDEEATEQTKTYFWLLATSGLRQSEAYELLWGDIDWNNQAVRLRAETTKARVARTAPLQNYVFERLGRMRKSISMQNPGKPEPTQRIFTRVPSTQPGRHAVLHRAIIAANKELASLNSQETIPVSGLHCFRHSCACILYSPDDEGRLPNIKAVAAVLGHTPQVSLQYYIKNSSQEESRNLLNSKFEVSNGMKGVIDDMIDLL